MFRDIIIKHVAITLLDLLKAFKKKWKYDFGFNILEIFWQQRIKQRQQFTDIKYINLLIRI